MYIEDLTSNLMAHIIDDHQMARRSLQWLLDSAQIKTQLWERGEDFLATTSANKLGVALLDIRMPTMGGLEVFEQLLQQDSSLRVIFMTGYADVPLAVRAIELGAIGFLTKPYSDEEMLALVRRGFRASVDSYVHKYQFEEAKRAWTNLSPRELDVVRLLLEEKPNRIIAQELGLSAKTIEGHKARVFLRLGVRSSIGLCRMADLVGFPRKDVHKEL